MDLYLTTLTLSFTPEVVAAIFGGLLGAWISSDIKRYGWQLSFMFMIAAVAFAGAMGEYLNVTRGIKSIFWLFILNIPLGMIVGSLLDVIRIANRPLIERLVIGIGNSGVSIVLESVIGRLAKFFGVDIPNIEGSGLGKDDDKNDKDKVDKEDVKKDDNYK